MFMASNPLPARCFLINQSARNLFLRQTFHTHLSVAQGIAYLDFGFIEPGALAVLSRAAREGKAMPERLDGKLVARVAMGLDVLQRLDQQLQQILQGLRGTKPTKPGKPNKP